MTKFILSGLAVLFLSIVSVDLSGQKSDQLIQPSKQETIVLRAGTLFDSTFPATEIFQKKGFIKGRLVKLNTNAPICFADISSKDKTVLLKSNSKGEFLLSPGVFPTTLKIRKFGYEDETIILDSPKDSVLISLTPLEVHKSYSGNKKLLQYELIFKKALEKFRADYNLGSQDHSQRELVYCRISSSIDSTVNSLFESYAHMNVNKYAVRGDQSDIARYASTERSSPGLIENSLEFKIDPFINLPMFIDGYINRKGFFEQNGSQIAMVGVNLGETKNLYYINVADTSIVYITSYFKSKSRNRIQGPTIVWQENKSSSTEISFSPGVENRNNYHISCINENEDFRLIQKNKPDQVISKSTLFAVIPDSSLISNAIRDHVMHETLTEAKQQINFNAKFSSSGKLTAFNSEKTPHFTDEIIENQFKLKHKKLSNGLTYLLELKKLT